MKQTLYSAIMVSIFSFALIACNGGTTTDGGADNNGGDIPVDKADPFVAHDNISIEAADILPLTSKPISILNQDGIAVEADSLTAVATAANGGAEGSYIAVTLQGLAVLGNDSTVYERETGATAWNESSKLKIDRSIKISNITAPSVTLKFDNQGKISAVTAYVDTDIIATGDETATGTKFTATNVDGTVIDVDRSTIFGFDSNYMVYINWSADKTLDDADSALTQTIYDSDGMLIAGLEAEIMPTSGLASFTGKGSGVFANTDANNSVTRYNTEFNVKADIDFTNKILDFTIDGTTCMGDNCPTDTNVIPDYLNFDFTSEQALSLAGATADDPAISSISTDLTLDETLTGKLDLRFYGSDNEGGNDNRAKEFGGTFALVETDKRYYYGVFGAERGAITPFTAGTTTSINSVGNIPAYAEKDTVIPASSLTAIASNADTGNIATDVTLHGLAVLRNDSKTYRRDTFNTEWTTDDSIVNINRQIDISRITASLAAVTLTFDVEGAISGVTVHGDRQEDYTIATKDRATIFGFTSDYMAHISWNANTAIDTENTALSQQAYDKDGTMIAGIETDIMDFPATTDTVDFDGKGSGAYYRVDGSNAIQSDYETIFDVTATADFGASTVAFTIANTKCIETGTPTDCVAGNVNKTGLDFTISAISFLDTESNVTNNISGAITVGSTGMTGTLDARFYGTDTREIGGTFAGTLNSETDKRYYYGAFGAQRDGISVGGYTVASYIYNVDNPKAESIAKDNNEMAYLSLTEAANDSDKSDKQFILKGLATQGSRDNVTYNRNFEHQAWATKADITQHETSIASINGTAASLTFDVSGDIIAATIHTNNGTENITYQSTGSFTNSNAVATADIDTATIDGFIDATTKTISVDRSMGTLGFNSNYMALVDWNISRGVSDFDNASTKIKDSTYNINGFMVAGMETTASDFANLSSAVDFTGKGHGFYITETSEEHVISDIVTTVDFSASTISIASTNSKKCTNGSFNSCAPSSITGLNFTMAQQTYTAGNAISGVINSQALTGTLDGQFYGADIWEFGGTFALADTTTENNMRYYYGAFGGLRVGVANGLTLDSTITDGTTISSFTASTSPASLDAVASMGSGTAFTMKALATYRNITTTYSRAPQQAWATHADAAESASLKTLTGSGASLTFDGTGITGVTAYVNAEYTDSGTATDEHSFDGTKVDVDRNSIFGFDSKYMAYISWSAGETVADITSTELTADINSVSGIMIAGIETAGTAVPASDITFVGKGKGVYGDINGAHNVSFGVLANLDATAREITLTTTGTACVNTCTIDTDALNFSSSELSYAENTNSISGAVSTKDVGNNVILSGTADARFYGADASEFGGRFALTQADTSYYYGAFGAEKAKYHLFADTETYPNWENAEQAHVFNGLSYSAFDDDVKTRTFEIKYITRTNDNTAAGDVKRIQKVNITTLNADGSSSSRNFDKHSFGGSNLGNTRYLNDANIGNTGYDTDANSGSLRLIHNTTSGGLSSQKWIAIIHDPDNGNPFNYHYQTFGITHDDTDKGGFSTGSFTNDLPTEGSASFTGRAYGYYNGGTAALRYVTRAWASVTVHFGTGTASFSTNSTKGSRVQDGNVNANSGIHGFGRSSSPTLNDLNIANTTLTYDPIYKWFRGDVSATLGDGDAVMRAYGPNAEEVGGVFKIESSDGTKTYAGGFGAVQ